MNTLDDSEQLNVVMVGHVDHGKSTLIGRLLADTGSLPRGKLEQVKATCKRNAKPFEYAFLLDALKNEQSQGITIDTARCFFQSDKRHYILIDAPGHVEFLKNMISGAARAEATLLVIDAEEGIQENSKRHGYMVSMLGVRQIAVLVNKMDLVNYDRARFEAIRKQYTEFLAKINVKPISFIPVSGMEGANITEGSSLTEWYDGPVLLEQLDAFEKPNPPTGAPFRFPVQDVYKFTESGDDRRILAGTVSTGTIESGQDVVFLPSGKCCTVEDVMRFSAPKTSRATAGEALGFTMTQQVYVTPGELMVRRDESQPHVAARFRANLFWMGRAPMLKGQNYKLKIGAARSPVTLVEILNVVDASELSSVTNKLQVDRHDVAECILECPKPIAFDLINDIEQTGRFVIVDNYEIAGAGTILESVKADRSVLMDHFLERERHWDSSAINAAERAQEFGHKAKFVVFTGSSADARPERAHGLAKLLEERLFNSGFKAYYLGIRNVNLGLEDGRTDTGSIEGIRHLGELARILTDSGQIFITSMPDLDQYDLRDLEILNRPNEILVINVGNGRAGNFHVALDLADDLSEDAAVDRVRDLLKKREVIPDYMI